MNKTEILMVVYINYYLILKLKQKYAQKIPFYFLASDTLRTKIYLYYLIKNKILPKKRIFSEI